ncbi:hypothetical protein IEQ34_000624 [Dendrobium chrysotoxum]|uniref:Uncharacterized protein n=1 Tax=Dendrobium chrysotoxum TaxID=161865 RepID=A0AAV7HQE5_DENCH|nr:hypothetical protein IEQ34_000624 [Dendrobium chrysotoxum]
MTPRAVNTRHALEACTLQLHAWKPFQIQAQPAEPPNPYSFRSKKPCRSDRSTAPSLTADGVEFFRLSLLDDPTPPKSREERGFRWLVPRKRRRRGSRSVSGRSSDRSGRRRRGCCGGASAANATCSDFPPVTYGTDSSGELFLNGDGSWGSDISEVRVLRREGGGGEGSSFGPYPGGPDSQGNESGYGSENGYRGDAEFENGDEVDEEDEDGKHLFWGGRIVETKRMEIVGENNFGEQKAHHRCRRKKSDWRVFAPPR